MGQKLPSSSEQDARRAEALAELRSYHLEVVDRLARIETHAQGFVDRLEEHTEQDAANFHRLDSALDGVAIDVAVAKAVGGREGRKRGAWWATTISALAVAVAEAARALGWL